MTLIFCVLLTGAQPAHGAETEARFFIREYRVEGVKSLPAARIEDTVYNFLGPERTIKDIDACRLALETLYRAEGYQAAAVFVPEQEITAAGIVRIQVLEGTVSKTRVTGSKYHSLAEIKRRAPSLAEGKVINFKQVTDDIMALNQTADRRVKPLLKAGTEPGTVEVDLAVDDSLPLHGSIELNNRYSANTSQLRLNASLSYQNLWQRGHTLGFNFQVAPENNNDALVYSTYYLLRVESVPWLSLMLTATKQDSDISTLGGGGVIGRGETLGLKAIMTLPAAKDFYHSVIAGLDYKDYEQDLRSGGSVTRAPITYYPLSALYTASITKPKATTELSLGPTLHVRGFGSFGSDEATFNNRRFGASASFLYLRGDLSHTRQLPFDFQVKGSVQAQVSAQPLLDTEQFSAGGLTSVRGYLESEATGDHGFVLSTELRSPSLLPLLGEKTGEWRFYGFAEGGGIYLDRTLPGQNMDTTLLSVGLGSRLRLRDHFSGSLDLGFPLQSLPVSSPDTSRSGDWRLTFRIGADY